MPVNPPSESSNTSVNTTAYDQPFSLGTAMQNPRVIAAIVTVAGAIGATLAFLNKCCLRSSKVPFSSSSPTGGNQGAQHSNFFSNLWDKFGPQKPTGPITGPIIGSSEKSPNLLNPSQMSIDLTRILKLPQQQQIQLQSQQISSNEIKKLRSRIIFKNSYEELLRNSVTRLQNKCKRLEQQHNEVLQKKRMLETRIMDLCEMNQWAKNGVTTTEENRKEETIAFTNQLIQQDVQPLHELSLREEEISKRLLTAQQQLTQLKQEPPSSSRSNLSPRSVSFFPDPTGQQEAGLSQEEEQDARVWKEAFSDLKNQLVQQVKKERTALEEKLLSISKQRKELEERINKQEQIDNFWVTDKLTSMYKSSRQLLSLQQEIEKEQLEVNQEFEELNNFGPS